MGNALLDYVIEHPESAGTPEQYCRRTWRPATPFIGWVEIHRRSRLLVLNLAHDFFAWYIETRLCQRDKSGRPIPTVAHINPLPKKTRPSLPSETAKIALPTRYVRTLLRMLMDDDWAWAKQIEGDWVVLPDPETGERKKVWSPVRASALAILLMLPLRSFQARMLDSGEGDSNIYSGGIWQANTGRNAPLPGVRCRQGFLRCFTDRAASRELTGFYINTNKTSKTLPGSADTGYEMPWEHQAVIKVASELANWQARFNPISGPLPWSEVSELVLRPTGRFRDGGVHFLFRDPLNRDPRQPLPYHALNTLWVHLLHDLEGRLAASGECRPDGTPVRLTAPTRFRRRTPIFGLHSLRVGLLSSLAMEGGVPLHILSKTIAGHASLVMTLHYLKTDDAELNKCLNEATARIVATEQEAFARHLASEARDEKCFVSNDGAGIAALAQNDAGLWKSMTTGLCPVGGTRCGDGGPALGKNRHAPVPNGSMNCPACRFHLTGPAFLPGLVARFNAISMSFEAARNELRKAEAALSQAEDRRFDIEQTGIRVSDSEVAQAQARCEVANARVEGAIRNLSVTYDLIERCKATLKPGHAGLNLVLPGTVPDLEVALKETTQIELWDAICRNAELHPSSETDHAVMQRSRALDRMLVRSGAAPLFMHLDDEVARAAGNELVRLMMNQMGSDATLNIIDGRIPEVEADVAALIVKTASSLRSSRPALLGSQGASQ